jgi:sugar phosphate isomerase/epimerase
MLRAWGSLLDSDQNIICVEVRELVSGCFDATGDLKQQKTSLSGSSDYTQAPWIAYTTGMPSQPLRYSVTATALSTDPREAPTLARQLGFAGVLFEAFSPSLDITTLSSTGRREFRHLIASTGMELVGVRADLGPKGLWPGADVDRILSKLDQVFESAVGIGAGVTCIDLGPLPAPAVEAKPKPAVSPQLAGLIIVPSLSDEPAADSAPATPVPDAAVVSQVDAAMFELGRRADRYNAAIAFSSSLAGFAALERALLAARCPWFGVDFDPIATLSDSWKLDEIFSRLGGLVRHVRGRDAVAGAEGRSKPAVIARGDVKWRALLEGLSSAGHSGWITVDPLELPDRRAAAVAGLKQLKAYGE